MDGDLLPLIAAVFAVIAFLYGSVGLGGGSAYIAVMAVVGVDHNTAPVLILGRLATPKQTAGVCAAFIVLNSVAGLAGRVTTGITIPWELLIPLGLTVLVFGQLGSLTGARRLGPVTIQATFGGILVLVAMRILVGLYGNI
jgi:hypothetical protein